MPFFNRATGTPRFQAAGLNATTPALGTAYQLPFNSIVTDPNGYWNAGLFRWQPLVSGWYWCSVQAMFIWTTGVVNGQTNVQLRKAGTLVYNAVETMQSVGASTGTVISCSGLINFNGSSDYLEGWAFFSNTAGVAGQTNGVSANNNLLSASYVGP